MTDLVNNKIIFNSPLRGSQFTDFYSDKDTTK